MSTSEPQNGKDDDHHKKKLIKACIMMELALALFLHAFICSIYLVVIYS